MTWEPFERAYSPPPTQEQIDGLLRVDPTLTRAEALAIFADIENDEIFRNNRYQVNIRHMSSPGGGWPNIVHLSIKRIDKDRVGPERYRDFMRIKDELTSPEFEAVEIYPARSDEVDTANQYHLWVFATPGAKMPFGWHGRRLIATTSDGGARQAPFDPEHRT